MPGHDSFCKLETKQKNRPPYFAENATEEGRTQASLWVLDSWVMLPEILTADSIKLIATSSTFVECWWWSSKPSLASLCSQTNIWAFFV